MKIFHCGIKSSYFSKIMGKAKFIKKMLNFLFWEIVIEERNIINNFIFGEERLFRQISNRPFDPHLPTEFLHVSIEHIHEWSPSISLSTNYD